MAYVQALLADLTADLALLESPRPIQSIFMGGGTPSLFSAAALETLLDGIQARLSLTADCEISLEANPGSFESAKFKQFRQIGINRLSIGIQSFNDQHLHKLGRVHNAAEAVNAVAIAQAAGFDNLNLDLMFGLPEQTQAQTLTDVQTAIDLQPSHISFYQLTLEPNTYFHRYPPKLPADESIYAAQQACQQLLADHGYQQYEISAYAQAGKQARHNLNYWQFGDYLGIGAGAHGKISQQLPDRIIRTTKPKSPEQYLKAATSSQEAVAIAQLPLEFVMNHLRLKSGFNLKAYPGLTGLAIESLEPGLSQAIQLGLLSNHQQQICCSAKGWDFLDLILEKFIQD